MTETSWVDMGPFLERHDRRTRRSFIAMLSLSLLLSAVNLARVSQLGEPSGATFGALFMPVVWSPFTIVLLWLASWLYGRRRPTFAEGRVRMNPDDARNVIRVANAGGVFVTGFCLVAIACQASWLLWTMGLLPHAETWGLRATLAAIGALTIHFGNVSPRLPIPRAPEHKPGLRMKYNRVGGWMTVILGLLLVLAGLVLPFAALAPAVGALGVAALLGFPMLAIMYWLALRSPSVR